MKPTLICWFLLLSISVLSHWKVSAAAPREPMCDGFNGGFCTLEYIPVCGTDGNTYPNKCALCQYNRETKSEVMVMSQGPCPH